MINKDLEKILNNIGCFSCIKIIEMCEKDKFVSELHVDKKIGFTNIKEVNVIVEEYVASLNVKVIYTDMAKKMKELLPDDSQVTPNAFALRKPKNTCKNEIHKILKKNFKKEKLLVIFEKKKYNMFRVDNSSFINCPMCNEIVQIKGE